MDSVNTAIRCPYSTLPRNGRVPKKIRKKKKDVQVLQIYKGADYTTEDAIGIDKVYSQVFEQSKVPKDRKLRRKRKMRIIERLEVTKNRKSEIVTDTPSKNEHKIEEAEANTEFRNWCCSP
jgi:hypothetical protein